MGTVAGNLCQAVRCWYFRHPDLQCWLRGGDTCYAQIGDHRKHGLEPGDCISVAPSDLAAALLALDAVVTTNLREGFPLADLYRRASADDRSTVALAQGELITAVTVPRAPARERLRARRGAGGVELRPVRGRRGPLRRRDAARRDRRLQPAPPARPGRSAGGPAGPRDDRLEAAAAAGAGRRRARGGGVSRIGIAAAALLAAVLLAPAAAASTRLVQTPLKTKPAPVNEESPSAAPGEFAWVQNSRIAPAPLQRLRPERRRHALPGQPGRDAGRPRHRHRRPHARLHPAARHEGEHPHVRPADAHRQRTAGRGEHAERRGRAVDLGQLAALSPPRGWGVPGPAGPAHQPDDGRDQDARVGAGRARLPRGRPGQRQLRGLHAVAGRDAVQRVGVRHRGKDADRGPQPAEQAALGAGREPAGHRLLRGERSGLRLAASPWRSTRSAARWSPWAR